MRLKLILRPLVANQALIFNYHHPFASWIYDRINSSDASYATFLHQKGYQAEHSPKHFKHFTFSKFEVGEFAKPIASGDDAMFLGLKPISVVVSFYVEQAAQNFILGIFKDQKLSIFNKYHTADFIVEEVLRLPQLVIAENTLRLKALTPMVIAEKQTNGNDLYLNPEDPKFANYFAINLISKYQSLQNSSLKVDLETARQLVKFELLDTSRMKQKVVTIKQNKDAATQIKGYFGFSFMLTAPKELIEIGYYGGFGKYCSVAGMGFTELF